jgi:hypothetical protein
MAESSQYTLQIMEIKTRFDLTAAVEIWREELASQSGLTPDNRRELEAHLCDTLAELRRRGLNDEESFWLARRRTGQPAQLAEEFVKTSPTEVWRMRVLWMAIGLVGSYVFMTWKDLLATWLDQDNYFWTEWLYLIPLLALILAVAMLRRGRLAGGKHLEAVSPWKLACGLFAVLAATVTMAYVRGRHLPGDNMLSVGYNIGMVLSWYANAVWPFVTVLILLLTLKSERKVAS